MLKISNFQSIPVLYFFLLCATSYVLHFNGVYGQDAPEYLRQSQELWLRLQGLPFAAAGPGEAEFAGGYPLLGAFLQLIGLEAGLAMQLISWFAAAAALYLFERNLRLLSPGAHPKSRWVYCVLGLGLAPYFVRAGLTVMSDALGLAFVLAAMYFGLRALEQARGRDAFAFAAFTAFAITTRYALAAVFLVPVLALVLEFWRMRRIGSLGIFIALGLAACWPAWWLKATVAGSLLSHSLVQDWSLLNLFKMSFTQASGTISYSLPNIVYLFFPFMHPGFCIALPGLFLLAKQTDVRLYTKRMLALSLLVYLVFLGGFPLQNLRYLLPAYAFVLLLLFPAWDRFFAYGRYFLKRLTHALIGIALLCQVVFGLLVFKPVWARHQLERGLVEALNEALPSGAVLYSFDVDIALKGYLPEVEFRNLWAQRYDSFPNGSYILFNAPKLREQWAGQTPMLNWEYARAHFELLELQQFEDGWVLYQIKKPK